MVSAKLGKTLYSEVQRLFSKSIGSEVNEIEPLTSHGSDRIIVRMRSIKGRSAIGIINYNTSENRAFIGFAKHFRNHGLNVPEIYSESADGIYFVMEDLGDITLLDKVFECRQAGQDELERKYYLEAIGALPLFQIVAGRSIDYALCYQFKEFGRENIRFDINYFIERFLKNFYRPEIDDWKLEAEFKMLTSKLLEMDRDSFLYRDFQSRNIMVKNDKLFFIDFQSGRRGSLLYDIASLLYDAKANISNQKREEYLLHYLDKISEYKNINRDLYYEHFWYFAVIRILQAMGAYGFLGLSKGKSHFLDSVPLALKNICFIIDNKINKSNFKYMREIFSEILL